MIRAVEFVSALFFSCRRLRLSSARRFFSVSRRRFSKVFWFFATRPLALKVGCSGNTSAWLASTAIEAANARSSNYVGHYRHRDRYVLCEAALRSL